MINIGAAALVHCKPAPPRSTDFATRLFCIVGHLICLFLWTFKCVTALMFPADHGTCHRFTMQIKYIRCKT